MAFQLTLPARLRAAGWKVKIRDRERLEPPHVTVLLRTDAWRLDLRTLRWMDKRPDPKLVPPELVELIQRNVAELIAAWDRLYPGNPVRTEE